MIINTELIIKNSNLDQHVKMEMIRDVKKSDFVSRLLARPKEDFLDLLKTVQYANMMINKESVTGLDDLVFALMRYEEEQIYICDIRHSKGTYTLVIDKNMNKLIGYFKSIDLGYR